MTHTCKFCEHFIGGQCKMADEVINKHGNSNLHEWTERPGETNICSLFEPLYHEYEAKRWSNWRRILSWRDARMKVRALKSGLWGKNIDIKLGDIGYIVRETEGYYSVEWEGHPTVMEVYPDKGYTEKDGWVVKKDKVEVVND